MGFAIIKTGGKQYKIAEGDILKVEKLPIEEGKTVTFDQVLLIDDGQKTIVGKPLITGAKVTAEVVSTARGKKISVLKYKNKTRYRKLLGHRQWHSRIKIKAITNK
jgi:large subunit ribosomal protein L21